MVGINTALRISDLLQLQISHFWDEQGRIRHRFWIKERKRGKRCEVVINASIREALAEYLAAYPDVEEDRNNFVFFNSKANDYSLPIKRGQALPLISRRKSEQVLLYRAKESMCNACSVKCECTGSKSGRHIYRSFFQEYLDKAEAYRQTEAYQKAMRKRSVWVEPLFGEAKEFHRLRRFRLRCLLKVNTKGLMIAAGKNLKRLIKHKLGMYFSFLKIAFLRLNFHQIPTFSTA